MALGRFIKEVNKMKQVLEVNGITLIGTEEELLKLRQIITIGANTCWDRLKHYREEEPIEVLQEYYEDRANMAHDLQEEMSRQLGEDIV